MNRDDIIRMAKEAGLTPEPFCRWGGYTDDLERFAALVAAEKDQQMIRDGWRKCAEGQRTTQFCGLLEEAMKAEREACAKVCEDSISPYVTDSGGMKLVTLALAAAIRARGEQEQPR